jgi:hypothetical protein
MRHEDIVEPLTNYGVARLQKDFNGGRSALGGIITSVNRRLPLALRDLRSNAYAGGIDGRHRFGSGNWEMTGQLLVSRVGGSEEAIASTQTSSARYFQRPDAEHLDYDPTRRSLSGTSGSFGLGKIGGGRWRGSVAASWVSPGFEANDLGFLRQADVFRNSLWIGYREFEPGKIFRRYNVNFNVWNWNTFGGERTATGSNVNGSFTLLNYWGGFAYLNHEFSAVTTQTLRGGPSMTYPSSWNWEAGFFSDSRKAVELEAGTWRWFDQERSDAGGYFAYLGFRPLANFNLSVGPQYRWMNDDWQFVDSQEALGEPRYIMGVLDQKTIALTTRLEWTFTPDLSLQLYAQPFVSAGSYTGFKRVVEPHASAYDDRFDTFGPDRIAYEESTRPDVPGTYSVDIDANGTSDLVFDDPNFTVKELRSTVVLRWEYLSGSTLFFVWSMNKSAGDYTGRFDPLDDLGSLRDIEGDNIFSIKVNYYLRP